LIVKEDGNVALIIEDEKGEKLEQILQWVFYDYLS